MNRREILKSLVALILPFGLVGKVLGITPKKSKGIWGLIHVNIFDAGVFCKCEVGWYVTQKVCINDFARRALKLHPSLQKAEVCGWITVYFGTKEDCWEAFQQIKRKYPLVPWSLPIFNMENEVRWVKLSVHHPARHNIKVNKYGWRCRFPNGESIPATF